MFQLIKQIFVVVFISLVSGLILVACGGGGGGTDSGGGTTTATQPQAASSEGGGEGEGEGEGGGGDGVAGGGNGGEAAGVCKRLILKRTDFFLVQEITQKSAPAEEKQLIIDVLDACKDFTAPPTRSVFTTNNGNLDEGIECFDPDFLEEYQSAFGVINKDCDDPF